MKNINKLIFHYICEIIVVIIFVGVSIPLWEKLDKSNIANVANSYSNMDYLYLDINKYIGYNEFMDEVSVINDTNTSRNYMLILKINKNIDTNNVNIILNEDKEKLEDLKYNEDNEYNYYLLAYGDIVASKKVYNILFEDSKFNYDDITYQIIENKNI